MAVGYANQQAAADDPAFQQIIEAVIAKAAGDIYNEPNTTPGHQQRATLSTTVLNQPQSFIKPFALAAAVQGVDKTSTDQAIYNAVASAWNDMAGA